MKNKNKTKYIWAITLVIAGLMIASAASIPAVKDSTGASSVSVKKLDMEPQTLKVPFSGEVSLEQRVMPLDSNEAFAFEGDQLHPGFGRTLTGKQVAAYRDVEFGQIIWTFSADDGLTYDPGVYYEMGGDYPSIKQWEGDTFFGTHVTDYEDLGGGPTYRFMCTDPLDVATYELIYWDWSSYGWNDMIDADVGCDSSQNPWEWGFMSYVTSTTYADSPYEHGPTTVYCDPDDSNSGWISWYQINNCSHTDIDIDHTESNGGIWAYMVYDIDEHQDGNWSLLCRVKDFVNAHQGSDSMYDIAGDGNLRYPAVAAQEGNIVILAETDENGNKDVICLYGTSISSGLQTSFVADGVDDETYPDVRHVQGEKFECVFVSNGKLYKSLSEDAGATWSTPEEVDDCVEEYKTADLTDYAVKAMYGLDNGEDIDVWITDIGEGPLFPMFEVTSITGGIGATATVKNIGTAAATNAELEIQVTGGILGLIDKNGSESIASLAIGDEASVGTGLIFGLGAIEIVFTVTCDERISIEETADGTQLIIFTIVNWP